jgi:dienelactone hydrolase
MSSEHDDSGPRARNSGGGPYAHLGNFSDWVDFAWEQNRVYLEPDSGPLTSTRVRNMLGFERDHPPHDVRVGNSWERDGVVGEEVSWSVGYGPRTHSWLLRPAGARGPLPGVLALHDHSGFKYFGKEKIADGPEAPHRLVVDLRRRQYGGRAFANELAREGFVVLVHDVFLWGSRRFALADVSPDQDAQEELEWLPPVRTHRSPSTKEWDQTKEIIFYNGAAVQHEHVVAKYCALLGSSLAGVVAYEDRVALQYLKSRRDLVSQRLGCIGLSGGGCRAALLQATSSDISASVIVDMMSTYAQLLDRNVAPHTWMLFPPGLGRVADWPDLAACRAPSPLVVQYSRHDHLFSLAGMLAAHDKLLGSYTLAGTLQAYVGQFFDGPHCFDLAMQAAAFEQLARWLSQ